MRIYVVCSTGDNLLENAYDVFKTKSKANKRLKEINDDIEREELHAYIKEYDFSANKTGLIEAFAYGLRLADYDSVRDIEVN
tara:strand:- start:417 stop:662 length:246 start_codon:yes stop_codon:yes gene_type:complete